jgi:cystathionine gamma-lyase
VTPGDGTRAVNAGLPPPRQGAPLLPGPTFASYYHLEGDPQDVDYVYGRYGNPTWTLYERALGELEGGTAVAFPSGMAAASAVLVPLLLGAGDVLIAPADGYPAVRTLATGHLSDCGVEVRLVPAAESPSDEALRGAKIVWIETPSNPGLETIDIGAVAQRAHAAGALVAVDNTLATPLGQLPLELGADYSVSSDSKHLTGHGDLILGHVAVADPARAEALVAWRTQTGAVPGPFEAWLAHRSLATLGLRLERQEANARALAEALRARDDVSDVRWPGVGSVVCFDAGSQARAEAFLGGCELVAEATSFGGLHSSAERRARWGSDAVAEGFIRFNAGIEDAPDLVADVERALELSRP